MGNSKGTLRKKIITLITALVILQSIALIVALFAADVFFLIDEESFRLFSNTVQARTQSFDTDMDVLMLALARKTEVAGDKIRRLAVKRDIPAAQIYSDDEVYLETALLSSNYLVELLRENDITGAFVLLNGSNNDPESNGAHSGVYLRNTAPRYSQQHAGGFQLEVGPLAVAREHRAETAVNWQLDLKLGERTDEERAFFDRPQAAAIAICDGNPENCGYWMRPQDILREGRTVITYTQPLVDENKQPFGVMGIEVSLNYLTQKMLPKTELPYHSGFYAIVPPADEALELEWLVPGGPLAEVYLSTGHYYPLAPVRRTDLYKVHVDDARKMYLSLNRLKTHGKNSFFAGEDWALAGFVPQRELEAGTAKVRLILFSSIIFTTVAAILGSLVLAFVSTKRISRLSSQVKLLDANREAKFARTGLSEIDDMLTALERFNQRAVLAAETTAKILELTLLPIGGFELDHHGEEVVVTEFIYDLLGIERGTQLSKGAWERQYARLRSKPVPGSADVFSYEDPVRGEQRWLRIVESELAERTIGVILDVTHDVEEKKRLEFELDHDPLTKIYNRVAFKREVNDLIQNQPDKVGAMVFSDLDNLKYINDCYGHDFGDKLLIAAASSFRRMERLGAVVSRISGDEFAIYLHGISDKERLVKTVVRQYERAKNKVIDLPDGEEHPIRFSSGLAWYPMDADNVTDLLKLSDYAMYEAKHSSKGNLFLFDRDSYEKNERLFAKTQRTGEVDSSED